MLGVIVFENMLHSREIYITHNLTYREKSPDNILLLKVDIKICVYFWYFIFDYAFTIILWQ